MLAFFRDQAYGLAERPSMSKATAIAAVSTQCGFANGAPELFAIRQSSGDSRSQHVSAALRMALLNSHRSIILIDSIPTLPPRTTSMLLNSSFISFTTASFFVAVCTNSTSTLSLP